MSEELINNYKRNKYSNNSNSLSIILTKLLLSIIFLMLSTILIKSNDNIKNFYKEEVFTNQVEFSKFNNIYNKYFGSILPSFTTKSEEVFNESNDTVVLEKYLNGTKIFISSGTFNSLNSGIIVFLGEKEELGNTCIVEGVDGVNIWYSNINTDNLTLYDYLSKDTPINSLSDNIVVTIDKNGTYLDYEEYTS